MSAFDAAANYQAAVRRLDAARERVRTADQAAREATREYRDACDAKALALAELDTAMAAGGAP